MRIVQENGKDLTILIFHNQYPGLIYFYVQHLIFLHWIKETSGIVTDVWYSLFFHVEPDLYEYLDNSADDWFNFQVLLTWNECLFVLFIDLYVDI